MFIDGAQEASVTFSIISLGVLGLRDRFAV
jgi:hypothetical protein